MSNARRRKRILRMHTLRDQAGQWAAEHHPEEFERSVRCWLGPHTPDEDLVMQGIGFALVAGPADGGPSLIARYAQARPPQARVERQILAAWRHTWFAVCELLSVEPGQHIVLEDVVTGAVFGVQETSASTTLTSGQWGLFFIVGIDGHYELEGTAMLLAPQGRIAAVQAMLHGLQELGLEPDPQTLTPEDVCRVAHRVVAAARQAERSPRLVNRDGHDLALVRANLRLEWPVFESTTAAWTDVLHDTDGRATWLGRHDPQLGGPLSLASFYPEGPGQGVVVVTTNSVERLDALRELWLDRVGSPLPVVEDQLEVEEVPSDPDGPRVEVDQSVVDAPGGSIADAKLGFRKHLAADWLDGAVPALGGLSPRQARAAGRLAEVRALLPTELPNELLSQLREELGI